MVEVTPPEDLMRERGVLERVLLIYEASIRKFELQNDFDPMIIANSAQIVHEFIEEYHEKSEEQHVFPRFKQTGKMVGLIETLLQQHEAGRRVTQTILRTAQQSRRLGEPRRQLISAMRISPQCTGRTPRARKPSSSRNSSIWYRRMNTGPWRKNSRKRNIAGFGDDGFEKIIERVARLERAIGIYDLNQFTPG
jgi:hypothetical protein